MPHTRRPASRVRHWQVDWREASSHPPMATSDDSLAAIRDFERQLDTALEALPSLRCSGSECLLQSGNIIETASTDRGRGLDDVLGHGLLVLAPYFAQTSEGPTPDLVQLTHDLLFAGHYYRLRDLLYYAYNAPAALDWQFGSGGVTIRFADQTIPRQYYLEVNQFVVGSAEIFADFDASERIIALLSAHAPGTEFPELEEVSELIRREIEIKLGAYYSLLDPEAKVPLGPFTYAQFHRVYRELLATALYHRYQYKANGAIGSVTWPREELVGALAALTALPSDICAAVLDEITFDRASAKRRLQPLHFGLYAIDEGRRLLMLPHVFATWEGLISIMRLSALRRPQLFLTEVSGPLSRSLVARVRAMFEKQGFTVSTDVQLNHFEPSLPDIDVLVISEEPTLGYVVFACEVKNPIPPQWAKDRLRVLQEGSLSKAFEQLDAISAFFRSEQGVRFIRGRLPSKGLPHFGEEFLVLIREVIVTSASGGTFFGDRGRTVLDYRTLDRLLRRSDGDMHYVLHVISHLNEWLDASYKRGFEEVMVGPMRVRYEGVTPTAWMEFRQNEYKSVGRDVEMAADFIRDGYRPFDTLQDVERKEDIRDVGERE